jgi:stage II sporulation protein D
MKKLVVVGIILVVGVVTCFLIACRDLGSARKATEELLASIVQDEIPVDSPDSVTVFVETLQQFGLPQLEIVSLRPVFFGKARASITLNLGGEEGRIALELDKNQGRWRVSQAPETAVAVVRAQGQPRMALEIEGKAVLSRELIPLGVDKLLTVQGERWEWLDSGWIENMSWFRSFIHGQEGRLLVGMEDVELFGWDGKLAAATVANSFDYETIRVNISTTGHESVYHSQVKISSPNRWQVSEAVTGFSQELAAGSVSLEPVDTGMKLSGAFGQETFSHRLIFTPLGDDPLTVASISRSGNKPQYYGSIEVAPMKGGLVVANELPLEQYLHYVVPSEMPKSFGPAAMEVQAIAARTFAVSNLHASGWQSTSAHVVDSVLSQVYNNNGTNSVAQEAVAATRGQIIVAGDKPADIRYFSTSCGFSANSHEVWSGKPVAWLSSQPQFPGTRDIGDEEGFKDFILNPPADAYDQSSPWFRWQFSLPASQLADMLEKTLQDIFKANPDSVEKLEGDIFIPATEMPATPIGELLDLIPSSRGDGGILMAVEVEGSLGSWRINREYYIRQLLAPNGGKAILQRHDGSSLIDFSLLPSAFVFWDKEWQGNKLTGLRFYGGGFGHGVGMSQYGVKELAGLSWSPEEIIRHYFPGTQLKDIYK